MRTRLNLKQWMRKLGAIFLALAITAPVTSLAEAATSRTCSLCASEVSTLTIAPNMSEPGVDGDIGKLKHRWMQIPHWLGGTWQATSEMILQVFDFRQQQDVLGEPIRLSIQRTSVIGMQSDKFGRLWHCAGVPYTRTIEVGPYIERHEIVRVTPTECTESKVVVECVSFVTRIDRNSGDLLSAFREHSVTTYSPIRDGLIQVSFAINDYDMKNRPIFWSRKLCTEKRIKPFRIIDHDVERGELKMSFRRFLIEQRMPDALPND